MDYSIFYRRAINVSRIDKELELFDMLISAYNSSERVGRVFSDVRARRKIWLIHPEYLYTQLEAPSDCKAVAPISHDEVEQVNALLLEAGDLEGLNICIDITGFMRHVLVFLFAKLAYMGVDRVSVLYSEPISYFKQEATNFSTTTSGLVRPVRGISGGNSTQAVDHLIIAVGYDHKLISEVSNFKDDSLVHPIFAFPSLSPDMYQQSAIRAAESGDVAMRSEWISSRRFAPANDPFSTAAVVSKLIYDIDRGQSSANIYLSPLSTKVQALGFTLYWILEGKYRGGVTILLPECITYSRETSTGFKRLWFYDVELV